MTKRIIKTIGLLIAVMTTIGFATAATASATNIKVDVSKAKHSIEKQPVDPVMDNVDESSSGGSDSPECLQWETQYVNIYPVRNCVEWENTETNEDCPHWYATPWACELN